MSSASRWARSRQSRMVVIEQHPDYPGELVFQVFEGENAFY